MSYSVQEGKKASIRWLCRVLGVPRSSVYREPKSRDGRYKLNELLVQRIRKVIDKFPYYGFRRIHWRINWGAVKRVNRKAVHRILKLMGWSMKKRPKGLRPRVAGWKSATSKPNQRWAIDTSHFMTQKDGLCHITAIIGCCDRKIVGWRVFKSGKADVAAAALEDAFIRRNPSPGLKLRSDKGLVFGSKKFDKIARRPTCLTRTGRSDKGPQYAGNRFKKVFEAPLTQKSIAVEEYSLTLYCDLRVAFRY